MTTTYYIQTNYCEHCRRSTKTSIGLSAAGWKFLFYTDDKHKNAASWLIELLSGSSSICNEYDNQVSHEDFAHLIASKTGDKTVSADSNRGEYTTDDDFDYVARTYIE